MRSLAFRLLVVCLFGSLLVGCATNIELAPIDSARVAKVDVIDNRPADTKVYKSSDWAKAVRYLGDDSFSTPPLKQLAALLEVRLKPGSFTLQVDQFRVIDIFPIRKGQAMAGAFFGIGIALSVRVPTNDDSIQCIFSGKLGTHLIETAEGETYKLSPVGVMVANDPSFKSAVNGCLSKLAQKIADEADR